MPTYQHKVTGKMVTVMAGTLMSSAYKLVKDEPKEATKPEKADTSTKTDGEAATEKTAEKDEPKEATKPTAGKK